jgi:lipid-A-disaccharide synthase
MTRVYLIAGEVSGDVLGGRLMAALRRHRPDLEFAGVGGPRMAEQGLASLFPMQELALMGLLEVLPNLRRLKARLAETVADIERQRPAVVVTIDSPGFTLRVLDRIRPLGIPRAHYVAPQVWAWRESRVKHYPGKWESLLCLLPFEPDFFARHGLPARFVGHPVLESGAGTGDAARFRARHSLPASARLLVLMPGSRRTEITRLLPVFGHTLERLGARVPGVVPVVVAAPGLAGAVTAAAARWPARPLVVTETAEKHDLFAAADAALTKSGTSTLELALAGVPMAVAYRVNPVTGAIVRRLVKVKYAALVNLLSGREVVPELLQEKCNPARLADTLAGLLTDPAQAAAQRAAFRAVLDSLTPHGGTPSEAAAAAVLGLLDKA